MNLELGIFLDRKENGLTAEEIRYILIHVVRSFAQCQAKARSVSNLSRSSVESQKCINYVTSTGSSQTAVADLSLHT